MTKTKAILLIAAVVFFAYGNCLNNQLIGDSKALYVNNEFYKDVHNLKRLFRKDFVMDLNRLYVDPTEKIAYSGCISYRPVTGLSFFLDYFLWRLWPAGHHLTNILLHLLTGVVFYEFAFFLLKRRDMALLAALLFSTHPIHSEVVGDVGYRSDILATLFFFLTLVTYTKSFTAGKRGKFLLGLSYLFCFLALFSKESTLALPGILVLYDYTFLRKSAAKEFLKARLKCYAGYAAVWLFYVYIYFFVFSNTIYPKFLHLGLDLREHFLIILKIFYQYLSVFFLPFKVHLLPPLYAPPVESIRIHEISAALFVIVVALFFAFRRYRQNGIAAFCLFWFFVNYLPVSNLMPLPNPLAFRFLYLPSAGLFILAALLVQQGIDYLQKRSPHLRVGAYIKIAVIGLLMSFTIPNNMYFNSNISACKAMIRNYPLSSRPYWILGISYAEEGRYEEAVGYLKEYLGMGPHNKFIEEAQRDFLAYHALGKCYVDDPRMAEIYFKKALSLNPNFVAVYTDLAKVYLLKEDYRQSLAWAQEAIRRRDDFAIAYVYAAHSLIELGQMKEARTFLERAVELSPDDENVRYVKNFYNQRKKK